MDDALRNEFPPRSTSPIYIAVDAPSSESAQVESYATTLGGLSGVAAVAPPEDLGGGLWKVEVTPEQPALDDATKELVDEIRAQEAPFPVAVGGETASFVDQQASLKAHLPWALLVIALGTFVFLFAMTGSVLIPIKTFILNLLTLSAAFGILVFVFQEGRLEGLLDYTSAGALDATQPILLFAVAFALSTDYAVFLLTRIKEARDSGMGNTDAVAAGLERTGRIVTAAALLFSIAVGSLLDLGDRLHQGGRHRHRARRDHRRDDRAGPARPLAHEAARRVELVGAGAAQAPARPLRAQRGRAAAPGGGLGRVAEPDRGVPWRRGRSAPRPRRRGCR